MITIGTHLDAMIKELTERSLKERAATAGITEAEQRQRDQDEAARQQKRAEAAEGRWQEERALALAERNAGRATYGESLGLGVPCHVGHVMKLSGLSERSCGDGLDRATVWHVVVDAPLAIGRLKRGKGDLLCRRADTLGRRSMGITGTGDWDDLKDYDPGKVPVSCKACLAALERIQARHR